MPIMGLPPAPLLWLLNREKRKGQVRVPDLPSTPSIGVRIDV